MAVNLRGKKTSLDEEASIYTKRDESESEKSKWAKMTKQEKYIHFKTYYLRSVLIGVFVVALIGFFVYKDVIMKKDLVYRAAILNEGATDAPVVEFGENFVKFMKLNPEKNQASFQFYYTTSEMANQVGVAVASDMTQLSSLIYATELDTIIGSEEDIKNYLENGFFMDLTKLLTPQELEVIQEHLYIPDPERNKEGKPYGVYLNQSPTYQTIFKNGGKIVEKPICGIIFNSERKEQAKQLLYYLFPELQEGASKNGQ